MEQGDKDRDKDRRPIHVHLEWPDELRVLGWALWWLLLGVCLGISLDHFVHTWRMVLR
jgi:hypothetical protein